jgi:hypothetical protein
MPRAFSPAPGRLVQHCLWALLVLLCASLASPLIAQDNTPGSSYVTPFPDNDVYRLQVYGDSLAEGLLGGLTESFRGDNRLQIQRSRHAFSGVMRNEFAEELQSIESNLSRSPVHVAVVMVGLYDRNVWRPADSNRRFTVGSDEWKAEYGRRVDRLMKLLRGKGAALYWVGLPILRRSEASDDAQMINEVVRERAYVNGQKFIDVFSQFSGENNTFSPYGPDIEGKIRLLREADGAHFTAVGNRKLAHFVERELRRDLTQARTDRNIPLAGTDVEQKRVRQLAAPATPVTPTAPAKNPASQPAKDGKSSVPEKSASTTRTPGEASTPGGDMRADNTRITLKSTAPGGKEESATLDIVRPAIPAAVIAAVTRRESPDRASNLGDSITSEIAGGLTVISSVTLSSDTLSGDRRRLPPTQTPFYRVLVKGERLAPKPGRADDFSWPRPEPPPVSVFIEAETQPTTVRLSPARSRRAPNG